MELHINRHRRLEEIQAQFQNAFPYLRLAFYGREEYVRAGSFVRHELPGHLHLRDICPDGPEGTLRVDPRMKTGELEGALLKGYGLPVQVFRRSYGRWMPTWATDAWSLKQQNHYGRLMGERGVRLGAHHSSPIQTSTR